MFYRSGWLRCVGFICVVSFVHCYRWAFEGLSWCSSVCRMIGVGLLYYPSNNSTPHVLSEWMVEVCRFEVYRFGLCLCFVLVLTLGVILYITIIYYITIISYLILYSSYSSDLLLFLSFSPSSVLFLLILSFLPILIHSIRVGIWIHLFINNPIQQSDPACFIGVDGWGV